MGNRISDHCTWWMSPLCHLDNVQACRSRLICRLHDACLTLHYRLRGA